MKEIEHPGEPNRDCEVHYARRDDGHSPYVVPWGDSGHETLFFPGRDATVEHFRARVEVNISTERSNVLRTIEAVRRSRVGIGPERTIREAARMMEQSGIGALAVIDGEHLVGIVTDRDLVRRGLARDLPADARVDAVMTTPVVTIDAAADLHDTFALFRTHAVRRLALVRAGQFVGVITIIDDLLIDLAADLSDLALWVPKTRPGILSRRFARATGCGDALGPFRARSSRGEPAVVKAANFAKRFDP